MRNASSLVSLLCMALSVLASGASAAESPARFAVEIRIGDKWDATKPPQDQLYFRDHSANLKRLRDAGHLIMGARYSDVGLIIIAAASEAQVRSMMDEDPSFEAGVFRYEVHPFNVFYPGTL